MDWLDKRIPPWDDYWEFMSGRLISLNQLPRIRPVGVGETWRQIIAKCVLNITGPEATHTCKDDQLYAVLKAGMNGVSHIVQYILGSYSNKEN